MPKRLFKASIVLVAMLLLNCTEKESRLERQVRQAGAAVPRPIEGRLSTSLDYSPWKGRERALHNFPSLAFAEPDRRGYAPASLGQQADKLHFAGLMNLYRSEFQVATEQLEEATRLNRSAPVLSDLAAAYLALAQDDRPWLLLEAVAAASAATRLEPQNAAAAFNLALSLEHLSMLHESERAWQRYLALERDRLWIEEASLHLARQRTSTSASIWPQVQDFARKAALRGDLGSSMDLARRFPAQYRELIENQLLGDWADSFGTERALEAMAMLRTAATAVSISGDRLYLDEVGRIEMGGPREQLAQGHRALVQAAAARADCSKAAPLLASAESLLESSGSPMAVLARLERLNCRYLEAPAETTSALQKMISDLGRKRYPILAARALTLLGQSAMSGGRHSEAIAAFAQARALFRENDDERTPLLTALDSSYFQAGDRHEAWEYRLNALQEARRVGDLRTIHASLINMAQDLSETEGGAVAGHVFGELLENSRKWGKKYAETEILLQKSVLALHSGEDQDFERDLADCEKSLNKVEQPGDRERLSCELEIVKAEHQIFSHPAAAAKLLLATIPRLRSLGLGLLDARALLALGQSRLALQQKEQAAIDFDRALAIFEERRRHTADDHQRIAYFARAQDAFDAMIRLQAIERGNPAAAYLYAERVRARSLQDHWSAESLARPDDSLSERLRRIPTDSIVLTFVVLAERLLIFKLEQSSLSLIIVDLDRPALSRLVAEATRTLQIGRTEEIQRVAGDAYELLLRHALSGVPAEKRLFILPDRELNSLPFPALYDRSRGRFLVEDHSVAIVAQLDTVWQPEAQFFHDVTERVLVVADPASEHEGPVPQLPGARQEGQAIALLFPAAAELLMDRDATSRRILELLPDSDIFHLAAHVVLDPRNPLDSSVGTAPPDPPLRAKDLTRDNLHRAKLVFLSACDSAPGFPDGDREGTAGLVRAVQSAGVPTVVAALWDIEDRATAELAPAFYSHLLGGDPPAQALRRAQVEQIRDPVDGHSRFTWAAFQLYRAPG